MKHFQILALLALFALLAPAAQADGKGILGDWTTPNGSTVSIYRCGTSVCAKLVAVSSRELSRLDEENPNPAMRKRPLCGLEIGSAFRLTGPDHAEGGRLYDPNSGNTYSGWMNSDGNTLTLRGYVGISLFGRTETWTRTQTSIAPCQA